MSVPSVTEASNSTDTTSSDEIDDERVSRFLSDLHRPDDARRVLRYVLNHPDGVPLTKLVHDTLGQMDTRRNERFVRRLVKRNPRIFETDRSQAVWRVAPAYDCINLITGKQISKPPEGTVSDRDTALSLLKDQKMLNEAGRQILLDRFGRYVDGVDNQKIVLKNPGKSEQYAVLPYRTRFTDASRRNELWAKFHGAWENASDRYDNASLLTLTTDPKMHDSLKEAWENISESFNRLMSWLSQDNRLGERPDYIGVLEPTDSGLPHLHVVIFGHPYVVPQPALSNYWGKYQGEIVDIRRLRNRDGDWVRPDRARTDAPELLTDGGDPDDGGDELNASAYLGKYLSKLTDELGADPSELCDTDAEETEAWKLGLYWATNRQMVRTSHDLKPDDDTDDDDVMRVLTTWEFVGTWDRGDLPARILRNRRPRPEDAPPP